MKKVLTSSVILTATFMGINMFSSYADAADIPAMKEPSPLYSKLLNKNKAAAQNEDKKEDTTKAKPVKRLFSIQATKKVTPKKSNKAFPLTGKSKVAPKTPAGFKKPGKAKPIVSSLKITSFNKDNLEINNINRMHKRPARSIFGDPKDPNFDPASIPSTPIANGVPGNPLLYPTRIAVAFPKSLMFSEDDFDKISIAIDEGPFSRDPNKNFLDRERSIFKDGSLFVSAIVYEGNNNWSAWLNNRRITPTFDDPIVKVISIDQDAVELFIKGDTVANDRRVRLKANQTYLPTKAKIYEGIGTR